MNNKLRYVKVVKENIDIAFEIQSVIWENEPDYNGFSEKIANAREDNISFIVFLDGIPIGITGVYVEDVDNDSIWLDWFGVLANYRKRGFGRKILFDTIEYCKKLKCFDYLRLDTTYWKDRPALNLYDDVMDLKERYTAEDTKEVSYNYLIYTYSLHGKKVKPWNNKYLGLVSHYEKCKKDAL